LWKHAKGEGVIRGGDQNTTRIGSWMLDMGGRFKPHSKPSVQNEERRK